MPKSGVSEAVVEMGVGTQDVTHRELVVVNIVHNGLAFGFVVGSTVDNDSLTTLVANYITILLQHVADKALNLDHTGT